MKQFNLEYRELDIEVIHAQKMYSMNTPFYTSCLNKEIIAENASVGKCVLRV